MSSRAIAAKILKAVISDHLSLTEALKIKIPSTVAPKDVSLIKQYAYGTLRWYFRLKRIADQLLYKPLKPGHGDLQALLLIGLYQIIYLKTPDYAAVSETVAAVAKLKKLWAKALINQALRQFLNNPQSFLQKADSTLEGEYAHPQWIIDQLKIDWADHWRDILSANNQPGPMFLRVNFRQIQREDYLALLNKENIAAVPVEDIPQGLHLLEPLPVESVPGFWQGYCSVQDLASQHIVKLLDVKPKQRILDACAAPGGKACALLESEPEIQKLVAIDHDGQRLKLLEDNLSRLKLDRNTVELKVADATNPNAWWDGIPFDRILLDAPCSGSGVIRRHPDIKILRHPQDIAAYAEQQFLLLKNLWPLLAPGGLLLYTTCSVFPEENTLLIQKFCQTAEVEIFPVNVPHSLSPAIGCQLLPSVDGADGFYYALLAKKR